MFDSGRIARIDFFHLSYLNLVCRFFVDCFSCAKYATQPSASLRRGAGARLAAAGSSQRTGAAL